MLTKHEQWVIERKMLARKVEDDTGRLFDILITWPRCYVLRVVWEGDDTYLFAVTYPGVEGVREIRRGGDAARPYLERFKSVAGLSASSG